ncbi:MAG: alpha/beta fold hydrolase [Chitinophagales bacterium]
MNLNFKTFGQGFPVVILHGLLGSLDNWQSIAKKLGENFQVYILDQRNHGKSPHSEEFNYAILSHDLFDFFYQQGITQAHLIGHSMGGKVAMKFALENPDKVNKLIVVDITPAAYPDGHTHIFKALLQAQVATVGSREEVESFLKRNLEEDETTIQFLMKGLTRPENGADGFIWKFNLSSLYHNYDSISGSVYCDKPFMGSTLFIRGARSNYINSSNYSDIHHLFPNHELSEIKNAGHWVHAEKPTEFLDEVIKFLT